MFLAESRASLRPRSGPGSSAFSGYPCVLDSPLLSAAPSFPCPAFTVPRQDRFSCAPAGKEEGRESRKDRRCGRKGEEGTRRGRQERERTPRSQAAGSRGVGVSGRLKERGGCCSQRSPRQPFYARTRRQEGSGPQGRRARGEEERGRSARCSAPVMKVKTENKNGLDTKDSVLVPARRPRRASSWEGKGRPDPVGTPGCDSTYLVRRQARPAAPAAPAPRRVQMSRRRRAAV